ncbi:AMP-binding protein [Bailinhaonella thermotolerans]|uniref:AMP-dependent synthetase n=1 Tax=Bailinhaonella thermotolerans TaxID=1070861 RepID=A0A3A4ASI0_9ACTN|nr:AMP-binding protein [Bailinhaonella thermotolerans]RJL32858.1 AMP-dependent synthetase [Bailinhaonella thermotolerans]
MGAPRFDLATLHEAIAAAAPERECLVWRERRYTWGEVTERSRRLGNLLRARGLGFRGDAGEPWESGHDHLGLYLHNGPEYLEAMLGAHKARLAPFNVNYRYTGEELDYLFRDARPRVIVYHARFAPVLAPVAPEGTLLLQVADESGNPLAPGALDYEEALAASDPGPVQAEPGPDDLQILYTGGTTGMPKGVLWRIGDLIDGPLGLRRRDGSGYGSLEEAVARAVTSPHRLLPAPPLMHGTGTWYALSGWCAGATVVIAGTVDRLDVPGLLDDLERERVTGLAIVGDAFARPLVEELARHPRDLRLRAITSSGTMLGAGLKNRLAELVPGVRIVDTLGSSETGQQAVRLGAGDAPFTPSPGTAVLSADLTRRLSPGEEELGWLGKGGAVPLGYLGDPEKTARTFVTVGGERFAVPGDRARLLADGTVELHGRDATVINTGGEKVFAEEVETVLREIPGVLDALVVGRASERWGSEVVAVVALAEPYVGDDDLRAACAGRLARYKLPKAFVRVDRVARHPNGKPDYAWARAVAAGA